MIKVFEWLKNKLIIILSIIITGLIVYIIFGKGIVVNKTYNTTSNSLSNSMSYAGSMSIGFIGGQSQGNWVIKEKIITLPFTFNHTIENLTFKYKIINEFLNTLDPIQYCFAKVIYYDNTWIIYYPEIKQITDERKGKVKTTINIKTGK